LFARRRFKLATFGTITGIVTDSTGAVVPGIAAKSWVRIRDHPEVVTNESGIYEATHLNPGLHGLHAIGGFQEV
jgi:hypothetical protein